MRQLIGGPGIVAPRQGRSNEFPFTKRKSSAVGSVAASLVAALIALGGASHVDAQTPAATDSLPPLDASLLTNFLAATTDLQHHFHTTNLGELLETAQEQVVSTSLHFGEDTIRSISIDYSALSSRDTTIARVFTAHQFAPQRFAPTQASIIQALGTLFTMQFWDVPAPAPTSRLGQNLALVRAHESELDFYRTAVALPAKLSESRVTNYLALRQALQQYWAMPTHAALLQTAAATLRVPWFRAIGSNWYKVAHVYNYPTLAAQDATLAALFLAHHLTPAEYTAVHVSVYAALMDLIGYEMDPKGTPVPPPGSVGEHNVSVVRQQRAALLAAGLMPYQREAVALNEGGASGMYLDSLQSPWYIRPLHP